MYQPTSSDLYGVASQEMTQFWCLSKLVKSNNDARNSPERWDERGLASCTNCISVTPVWCHPFGKSSLAGSSQNLGPRLASYHWEKVAMENLHGFQVTVLLVLCTTIACGYKLSRRRLALMQAILQVTVETIRGYWPF
jgi:hypothetical protein